MKFPVSYAPALAPPPPCIFAQNIMEVKGRAFLTRGTCTVSRVFVVRPCFSLLGRAIHDASPSTVLACIIAFCWKMRLKWLTVIAVVVATTSYIVVAITCPNNTGK